jgi:hypothetical protein
MLFALCAVPFFHESDIRFMDATGRVFDGRLRALKQVALVLEVGSQRGSCAPHCTNAQRAIGSSVQLSESKLFPANPLTIWRLFCVRSPNTDSLLRLMLTTSSASC